MNTCWNKASLALIAAAAVAACGGGDNYVDLGEPTTKPEQIIAPHNVPPGHQADGTALPACPKVSAWDKDRRYKPGDRVSRLGKIYEATPESASGPGWNVNSPPEWTPKWWSVVNCA